MLFRSYFRGMPSDILLLRLIAPVTSLQYGTSPAISRPIIAPSASNTHVGSWNGYILPLIMLNSDSIPWPLGVMVYQAGFGTDWQLVRRSSHDHRPASSSSCQTHHCRRFDRWRRQIIQTPWQVLNCAISPSCKRRSCR
jgi:hypothetical protein